MRYHVVDQHTGFTIKTYVSLSKARREVDKLDCEYGAYRYCVKSVEWIRPNVKRDVKQ